jgi:hypothetical protein
MRSSSPGTNKCLCVGPLAFPVRRSFILLAKNCDLSVAFSLQGEADMVSEAVRHYVEHGRLAGGVYWLRMDAAVSPGPQGMIRSPS